MTSVRTRPSRVLPQRPRVAVVGATGAVGSTMLEVLAERSFPADEVVPFASERSAGRTLPWGGSELTCVALTDEAIQGFDIALFSAGSGVSAEWAPRFAEAGAVVVDNSSHWRMHEDVPLVVSEVNPEALGEHKGIVANPNCTTMQTVVALGPILREAGIERVVMSSYQAVSGTGQKAVNELAEQAQAVVGGNELPQPSVYPHQIAFNVLPQVETFKDGDDYTTEERKCMRETRKILGRDDVGVSATCVRVPVFTGHSVSANVQTRDAALTRGMPRAAGRRAGPDRDRRPRQRPLPDRARCRRPRRRPRRPDPPRPLARPLPQPLDRGRQPAQGRGDERRPGRRAVARARIAEGGAGGLNSRHGPDLRSCDDTKSGR